MKAGQCALELEDQREKFLEGLKTLASWEKGTNRIGFLGKFLDKENRNYLNDQLLIRRKEEVLSRKQI